MNAVDPTSELTWAAAMACLTVWAFRPRPPARRPGLSCDAAATPAPKRPRRDRRGRRSRSGEATLPLAHWCEAVARALRGGDSLRTAIAETPPNDAAASAVGAVRRLVDGSGPPERPGPDLALVLAVLTACLEQGGPAAEPLDRAAAVLRSRAAEQAERRVQSAQARLSARVLTWLPVMMLGVLVATSAAVRAVITTPLGMSVVAVGSILNLIGWSWMRSIVERAAR